MHRSNIWRRTNPDKAKEQAKRYYEKNKDGIIKHNAQYLKERPEYCMWNAAKQRAKRKGLDFNIDVSDIVIPSLCPYFKIPIINPSLDRINNEKGYIKGNVEVISLKANRMKNNASLAELVSFAQHVLEIY